ncbi:4-galactosyl-N-acetylglucosaminide 3-alpha-L-fucosyltransferase 9-like isoform X2 [Xyrauchen texanus]|uniref:4-galactosyl-N-acetylglucosaminide 3-alpha-L-fucosyltransferase 9-like isoform X2 n=1 Tax=Xyrauchen texanus TaxID=154827 RepID=UPI00224225B6|nr:4-galactosyl-N-acetylglucosaminide 3-alpha-L-fucosyltransferase 9-like isoform X2 [Xyrauchen texanus]
MHVCEGKTMSSRLGRFLRCPLLGVLLLMCLFMILCLLMYDSSSISYLTHHFGPIRPEQREVLILIWQWPFNQSFDLDICKLQFNIDGCHLTVDHELYSKADSVLIHHRDINWDLSNLPKSPRPFHQKWIWMNLESPSNTAKIPGIDNMFNVSLSYRQDSDIRMPYGWVVPTNQKLRDFIPPKKDKMVCWIVSNFQFHHRRARYYVELQRYLEIQTFGGSFNQPVSEESYREIIAGCRFYLSFENSEHNDYITEKLYNALQFGAVPIVLGPSRKNYERFIPRDAFIHVDDFPSVRDLAKYLLLLSRHEALYCRYFNWRRYFEVKISSFPAEHACYSCDYIRQHKEYQVLTNLYWWYWGVSEGLEEPRNMF